MDISGVQLIGQHAEKGSGGSIAAINPVTGETLEPVFNGSSLNDVNNACSLAKTAFSVYRHTTLEERARFLEAIAVELEAVASALVERAMLESGLPRVRLEGECARTCTQLRHFSQTVRSGEWLGVRIDTAMPSRQPMPRPDLRLRYIPLGPVAVFGASNFPLAFSVAGGDTASAFAAGCPVVCKAHSAHPGTSEIAGKAVLEACIKCGLPEGVFSLLFDEAVEVGQALVAHPAIQAVGFTGSRRGGLSLLATAQARPCPIPVYAEMSSINPVFMLPHALAKHSERLAQEFVASMTLGSGQFCTSPGLVIAEKGEALNQFTSVAQKLVSAATSQTMLTPGIQKAFVEGVNKLKENAHVQTVAEGLTSEEPCSCQARLFNVSAVDFIRDKTTQDEVFGASSLIVECADISEVHQIARLVEGQLTIGIHMTDDDLGMAQSLLPELEEKAGRILVNGWPTGVEVSHSMVHGGPFPATSDSRTTSVGSSAIKRFLRPVCYQNLPSALLPTELRDENPWGVSRLVDGVRVLADG